MKFHFTALFILALCKNAIAWEEFAKSFVVPQSQTTPFVFDMDIQWKLTMSFKEDDITSMVDFSPTEQQWYLRNMDPLMACKLQQPLINSSKLEQIVQLHGSHELTVTINGESPAKPMIVPLGAEVIMRVHNNLLTEGITIHIHGLDKRNLWFVDGVPFIQQCPISAGTDYSYRFIADTPGTHWFHGHYGTLRGQGLLGAFVVTKPDERVINAKGNKVMPSRQYIALLQDRPLTSHIVNWYNQEWNAVKWTYGYDQQEKCYSPTRMFDGSNVAAAVPLRAISVNAKGWHNQSELKTIPWALPLEKYRIRSGENILLRFIHGGTAQPLMVSVEGHKLTIVAADGQPVKPLVVNMIIMFTGERYDVLIEGKQNPELSTFYIIIETLEHYDWSWKKIDPFFGLAELVYEKTGQTDAHRIPNFKHRHCSPKNRCLVLNCPFAAFPKEFSFNCLSADSLRSLPQADDQNVGACAKTTIKNSSILIMTRILIKIDPFLFFSFISEE